MGILAFIVVLVALIVAHEFGHFAVAKWSGMRVDEFGLGYPPRAMTVAKRGETAYTLNWLPFGGFVKIYGEDPSAELGAGGRMDPRAFGARPRILQAAVLVAGVLMNLLVAYALLTGLLVAGTPRALAPGELARAKDLTLGVSAVLPGSPAAAAGIAPGDLIVSATDATGSWSAAADPAGFTDFVRQSAGAPVTLTLKHADKLETLAVAPATGLVAEDPARYALGVEVGAVGVVPL
ncbi:MAG: site-2 protease family protein, partial [Patescibacteria group bacterium]|nr:site-2 protease family protein [Patescibacteria group bacterium]